MESIQGSFNTKIISLERKKANLIHLWNVFEKERQIVLSEAKTMQRTENINQDLVEICENTKDIVDVRR